MSSERRLPEGAATHCAALPYRVLDGAVEVLLITSRGRGGWIIPKGKIKRGLGASESARREAEEEAGVDGEIGPAPFDEYRHGGDDEDPLVQVFLFRVTGELPEWPEADKRDRAWVPLRSAPRKVADPGLARVLCAAATYLALEGDVAKKDDAPQPVPGRMPAAPARRSGIPARVGLLVLAAVAVVALAAWALLSRKDAHEAGGDARNAVIASASAAEKSPAVAPLAADDSACRVVKPPVALSGRVSEASGIAAGRRAPGVLWTHNDSGDPVLHAFSPDGAPLGEVRVAGATVEDWEDVAAGPCPAGSCLYIADIGDNRASRARVTVYRVPEPAPADGQTRPAEAFHATYPDGAHDAEALFVLPDGAIYIVTKGETGPIALYRFPRPLRAGATARLERVVELGPAAERRRERITGASASPDGQWVALRTLDSMDLYRTADLTGGTIGTPIHVDLRSLKEAQGEGVGWGPGGVVYLSSESGKKNKPGTLAQLSCTP